MSIESLFFVKLASFGSLADGNELPRCSISLSESLRSGWVEEITGFFRLLKIWASRRKKNVTEMSNVYWKKCLNPSFVT
jgi:hypothetical protein